jgi:ornithine lipid ester-linked acyl 2-hydroxylase
MKTLWFSITSAENCYKGNEENFVQVGNEPWAVSLLEVYEDIKNELSQFLQKNEMVPYFHQGMVNKRDTWKTIGLKFWNVEIEKYKKHFPLAHQWLNQNKEVVSVSFSLLEPHSRILPHSGDTNAIYRVHLGIDIPEGLPRCGFRVKEQWHPWKEREFLAFLDAFEHEAVNDTEKSRCIIMLDVIRPEFKHRQRYICRQVLAALALQKLAASLNIHNHKPNAKPVKIPLWFRKTMAYCMLIPVTLILPLRSLWVKGRSIFKPVN